MTKERLKNRLKQKELLLQHYERQLTDQGKEISDLHQLVASLLKEVHNLKVCHTNQPQI